MKEIDKSNGYYCWLEYGEKKVFGVEQAVDLKVQWQSIRGLEKQQ